MANQVKKINTLSLSNIKKLNTLADAQLKKVNTLEFTRTVPAGSYSAASATLSTDRSRNAGFGVARTASATVGGNNTSSVKLTSCEEYDGSSISSGGTMGTARFAMTACGSQTVGLILGGTV